jgi:hypothetical protein
LSRDCLCTNGSHHHGGRGCKTAKAVVDRRSERKSISNLCRPGLWNELSVGDDFMPLVNRAHVK